MVNFTGGSWPPMIPVGANLRDYVKFGYPVYKESPELIGVDLDGVLFDFLGTAHDRIKSIPKNPSKFEVASDLDESERELFKKYLKSPEFWLTVPLYPKAIEFIDWLKHNNFRPIIITSREPEVRDVTVDRLHRLFDIPSEDIIFEKNKLAAALGLGISTHIEDSPPYIEDMNGLINVLVPIKSWNADYLSTLSEKDTVYPYRTYEEAKEILLEKRRKK